LNYLLPIKIENTLWTTSHMDIEIARN